jgi:hypothetical protein
MKNKYNIETAFFQTYKGEFVTEATFVAFVGCEQLDIKCIKFDLADIATLDITKNTPVFGGITAVRYALTQLGIKPPEPLDIPEELIPYTGRDIQFNTLGYFMENGKFPLFVKPRKAKLFVGMIVSSPDELSYLSQIDMAGDDQELIASSVVKFVAEFRVFVSKGIIYDCRSYSGKWNVIPDFSFIEDTIKNYKSAPDGYVIDFGVTDSGKTLLVEANDGYSFGSYGLNPTAYIEITIARWNQMVGLNN